MWTENGILHRLSSLDINHDVRVRKRVSQHVPVFKFRRHHTGFQAQCHEVTVMSPHTQGVTERGLDPQTYICF